jgi:hypothetical protein
MESGVPSATSWNQVLPETKNIMEEELKKRLGLPVRFSDNFFYEWLFKRCKRSKVRNPRRPGGRGGGGGGQSKRGDEGTASV